MCSTSRGPRATRVVAGSGVLMLFVLVLVVGVLVGNPSQADAGEPEPTPADRTAAFPAVRDLATGAAGRAVAVTGQLAAAATPPPPPPPPPVYCPAPGSQFVDSWGFARSGGRRHKGVDMMAPYGTPVIAPRAGLVKPSHSALGGIGFYLYDEAGNEYFGSHLASLDVTGWVEAGQQIGTVGSTGNAGTPHLHFEVKPVGQGSVNPFPFAWNWCTTDFSQPGASALLP